MAETLGSYGEYVEKAEDIRPTLEGAQKQADEGKVAVVNVRTDYRARRHTGLCPIRYLSDTLPERYAT